MPHVLVAGKIHEAGLRVLRDAPGISFEIVDEVSTESYAPRLPDADALLIRTQPLPGRVIASASRLRIVSRHGVGFDAVDVPALDARGIALATVGDVNSRPVAEHTLALMLAVAKRVPDYDAATRAGHWEVRNGFSAVELSRKTLFLIGFGRIGRLVAGMAAAFGMRIAVYDPFQSAEAIREAGAEPVGSIAAGLATADVVSLHVPKSDGGPLIGAAELALMQPGAILVNTARGDLIDEDALADALDEGRIAGAGLDVFATEPPSGGARLLRSDRTVLSPHSAALTRECAARMSQVAAQNIVDFFDGRLDPRLLANRPLYQP
jgi:D-3-phosphoglycerate dehydrogenase